jgi:exopolysaccharide biosynthesis protein
MTTPTRDRRVGSPARHALPSIALAAILAATLGIAVPAQARAAGKVGSAAVVVGFTPETTEQIAGSVTHQVGRIQTDSAGGQEVHVVTARAGDPTLRFQASLATGEVVGRATVTAQARAVSTDGNRVIAAVNGDVWGGYASPTQDAPNGIHVQDGELMVASTDTRSAFVVDASGRSTVGPAQVTLSVTGMDMVPYPVDRLNQLRRAGEVVAYTSRFGSLTPQEGSGIEVVLGGLPGPLTLNGSFPLSVMEVREAGSQPIAPGQVVLNGPTGTYLDAMTPGSLVTFTTAITPGLEGTRQLVTGRENILTNGVVDIRPRPAMADQLHPRSAIGVTAAGDVVVVTVDGRQTPYSTGVDLDELAQIMSSQGVVNAINLDGGGSTAIDVREPGDVEATLQNRPSDGRERAVANALLLVSTTPTGPPAQLFVRPPSATLYVGEKVAFEAKATDASFNGIPLSSSSVSWSSAGGAGTLTPDGTYAATAPGADTITASAIGLTAQLAVTVQPDTVAPVIGGTPVSRLTAQTTLTAKAVPLTVTWPAATDRGTGVASYEVQRSTDGGASWSDVTLDAPGKPKAIVYAVPGEVMRVRVRATDRAGNPGDWSQGLRFRVIAYQDASGKIAYKGTWKSTKSAPNFGGTVKYTLKKGGTATFAFTGSQVAWVTLKGPDRGQAQILLDGKAAATVDNRASRTVVRRVTYVKLFTGTGRHEITVKSLGTAGRPRVDMDALVVVVPAGD